MVWEPEREGSCFPEVVIVPDVVSRLAACPRSASPFLPTAPDLAQGWQVARHKYSCTTDSLAVSWVAQVLANEFWKEVSGLQVIPSQVRKQPV